MSEAVVQETLDLLDRQREEVFRSLEGLPAGATWQRPAAGEWCIGEILSHTVRTWRSLLQVLSLAWTVLGWYGRLRRNRPYRVEIDNIYQRPGVPMWIGVFLPPVHSPGKPVPPADLEKEVREAHRRVRAFFTGKPADVLGNIPVWDPFVGFANLITALKIGIDHDQLHYDDVALLAEHLRRGGGMAGGGAAGR